MPKLYNKLPSVSRSSVNVILTRLLLDSIGVIDKFQSGSITQFRFVIEVERPSGPVERPSMSTVAPFKQFKHSLNNISKLTNQPKKEKSSSEDIFASIRELLAKHGGDKSKVAAEIGISLRTLYGLLHSMEQSAPSAAASETTF